VAIPVSALRKGPGGDQVFVIAPGKDGRTRVTSRPVESSTMFGDEIVILSGLTVGEQVAALGSFKLRDGILVAITDPSANRLQEHRQAATP
jgi:membrane fusion protein (multidrug efflux system)